MDTDGSCSVRVTGKIVTPGVEADMSSVDMKGGETGREDEVNHVSVKSCVCL